MDGAALAERFAGRLDLLRQISTLFERQVAKSALDLRHALAKGDAGRARETAHGLVNIGGAVRSTPLMEIARRLEKAALGGDLAAAAALSEEALDVATEVSAWLRRHVEKLERGGEKSE